MQFIFPRLPIWKMKIQHLTKCAEIWCNSLDFFLSKKLFSNFPLSVSLSRHKGRKLESTEPSDRVEVNTGYKETIQFENIFVQNWMQWTLGSVLPSTMFNVGRLLLAMKGWSEGLLRKSWGDVGRGRWQKEGTQWSAMAFLVQFQTFSETYCVTNGLEDLIS